MLFVLTSQRKHGARRFAGRGCASIGRGDSERGGTRRTEQREARGKSGSDAGQKRLNELNTRVAAARRRWNGRAKQPACSQGPARSGVLRARPAPARLGRLAFGVVPRAMCATEAIGPHLGRDGEQRVCLGTGRVSSSNALRFGLVLAQQRTNQILPLPHENKFKTRIK